MAVLVFLPLRFLVDAPPLSGFLEPLVGSFFSLTLEVLFFFLGLALSTTAFDEACLVVSSLRVDWGFNFTSAGPVVSAIGA